jgi:hypothetical protein
MAIIITKPIAEHRESYLATVNQMASDKITARYPLYKQLNIARTSDAEIMNTWIDSIRALTQVAKTAIGAATTIVVIRTAQAIFIEALATV